MYTLLPRSAKIELLKSALPRLEATAALLGKAKVLARAPAASAVEGCPFHEPLCPLPSAHELKQLADISCAHSRQVRAASAHSAHLHAVVSSYTALLDAVEEGNSSIRALAAGE